jgi:hypothetical protein
VTKPVSRGVFDRDQLAELRANFGVKYGLLLPDLENAVLVYDCVLPRGKRPQLLAAKHADRARKLELATRRLERLLKEIDPFAHEACSMGFIPINRFSFAKSSLYDIATMRPRLKAANSARAVLGELLRDTQEWKNRASAMARSKPGRKVGNRVDLCAWLGHRLSTSGFTLSTRPTEMWGRLFTLMCEAVRIPVPSDVGRELRKALANLETHHGIAPKAQSPAKKKRR